MTCSKTLLAVFERMPKKFPWSEAHVSSISCKSHARFLYDKGNKCVHPFWTTPCSAFWLFLMSITAIDPVCPQAIFFRWVWRCFLKSNALQLFGDDTVIALNFVCNWTGSTLLKFSYVWWKGRYAWWLLRYGLANLKKNRDSSKRYLCAPHDWVIYWL